MGPGPGPSGDERRRRATRAWALGHGLGPGPRGDKGVDEGGKGRIRDKGGIRRADKGGGGI